MNNDKKSALDFVIVSKSLEKYLDKIEIDNERKFTPARATKKGRLTYTDHYAVICTFKNIPKNHQKVF